MPCFVHMTLFNTGNMFLVHASSMTVENCIVFWTIAACCVCCVLQDGGKLQ